MKFRLIIFAFSLLISLFSQAYDITLSATDENGNKITDVYLEAWDLELMSPVGDVVINNSDTTYTFRNLPDKKLSIGYVFDGGLFGIEVTSETSAATIMVPRIHRSLQLSEVEATADYSFIKDDRIVVIPTGREKKVALSGQDLISQCGIPSLRVDHKTHQVSTNIGEPVEFFIDYFPANDQEVNALLPRDVKKIEIFRNPSNVIFRGARNVVNFITVRYLYGVTLKLTRHNNFYNRKECMPLGQNSPTSQ